MMRSKMTKEEFDGGLAKFGLTQTEALNVLWLKTRVVLSLGNIQTHMDRYGALSGAYTAAFRLLFRELERDHEQA